MRTWASRLRNFPAPQPATLTDPFDDSLGVAIQTVEKTRLLLSD